MNEDFSYVTLLGRDALYSGSPDIPVPDGLYRYYLGDPHGYDYPDEISETVCNAHWGTVLLREPIDLAAINTDELLIAYYEDGGGNPIPFTVEDFLAGMEPAVLETGTEQDEDDLCF